MEKLLSEEIPLNLVARVTSVERLEEEGCTVVSFRVGRAGDEGSFKVEEYPVGEIRVSHDAVDRGLVKTKHLPGMIAEHMGTDLLLAVGERNKAEAQLNDIRAVFAI